jgi:zinc protease
MTSIKILAALCLLACGSSTALAQVRTEQPKEKPPTGSAPKPFTLPSKTTFTLKNGIPVTLVPYGAVPKVAITVVTRSGNVNEAANQAWLADLTGSMLKQGTTTRSGEQIAQESASMGGRVNVTVNADYTNVSGDVLSDYGPSLAGLLADVIQHPQFADGEVQRLKTNMLRQLSITRSQPGPIADERFRKILYGNHPYGQPYPTEEMLKAYTTDDVRKFYTENYGAARARIYVAGQFDDAAMRKAITAAFENMPSGNPPANNIPKPATIREIHLLDRPNTPQATVYVGLPVIDPSNPDYIAFQVTNALLGGSFASRITSNIREQKGYTYSPNSQIGVHYRDAYWVEIADVTTAVTGPSIKEIFYEIDRLGKEKPTQEELLGIQNYMAGIFVLQNSSRQGVIGQLLFNDLHGLPDDYLRTYVQKIMAVTPADVQGIAQKYLQSEKMAIVVVGDKAKVESQLSPFGKVMAY